MSPILSIHTIASQPVTGGQNIGEPQVRLMLEAGWPVDTPEEMGATALHWAGFNGNADMAREILRFHPALDLKSKEYAVTALSWACG